MTHDPWLSIIVPILVTIVILYSLGSALIEYAHRLETLTKKLTPIIGKIDRRAEEIIAHKNSRLDHWLGWTSSVPHLADFVTLSRIACIEYALACFRRQSYHEATQWFIIGWLTDIIDGPLARIRARRTGRTMRHGKYLDVGTDLYCFGRMVQTLHVRFPVLLMNIFSTTVAIRSLYGLALFLRRWVKWIRLSFLPDSTTGKYKTMFVALGFGLVICWPGSNVAADWAIGTLCGALVLELASLTQQYIRWRRIARSTLAPEAEPSQPSVPP